MKETRQFPCAKIRKCVKRVKCVKCVKRVKQTHYTLETTLRKKCQISHAASTATPSRQLGREAPKEFKRLRAFGAFVFSRALMNLMNLKNLMENSTKLDSHWHFSRSPAPAQALRPCRRCLQVGILSSPRPDTNTDPLRFPGFRLTGFLPFRKTDALDIITKFFRDSFKCSL